MVATIGCGGPRYRSEVMGRGALGPAPLPIPLEHGTYEIAIHVQTPRAQVIAWHLSCPDAGIERSGTMGETLEAYRARRAGELRAERDRTAAAASAAVGLFAPAARVSTANGHASATAAVDPNAVGAAAGATVDVVVPEWDVGRGAFFEKTRIELGATGVCNLGVDAPDQGVVASYQVTKERDLRAEERERERAAAASAIAVRGQVRAQLVALGADEQARAKRRAAEEAALAAARAKQMAIAQAAERERAEADLADRREREQAVRARLQLEASAKAERDAARQIEIAAASKARWEAEAPVRARVALEATWTAEARSHRSAYVAWLVGTCGADPHRRARVAAARQEAEARVALQVQMRLDMALRIRAQLRGRLVALGAVARPPMPAMIAEDPGSQPFDGAVWSAGRWTWTNLRWTWEAGGWIDATGEFGAAGRGDNPVVVRTPAHASTTTTTVGVEAAPAPVTVDPVPAASGGVTIDIPVRVPTVIIRTNARPAPREPARKPTVRDHRRRAR